MSNEKKESRIKVEDLPQEQKGLSADEHKQIQGGNTGVGTPGIRTGGTNTATGDTESTENGVANLFSKI